MVKRYSTSHVPERFLRQLWKHQHFSAEQLQATDGRSIEILFPGVLNRDGGPDFAFARVRIGGTLYCGDIELHQHADAWSEHCHDGDPKYNSVILHVVFEQRGPTSAALTASKRQIPVLVLAPYLTSPYRETWGRMILDERSERLATIRCYPVNDKLEAAAIWSWLAKLGTERIELKVRRFEERLKELIDERRRTVQEPPPGYDEVPFGLSPGELPPIVSQYTQRDFRGLRPWHQILYEGVLEALGYSKNREPFLTLARNLPIHSFNSLRGTESALQDIEAILFGTAGLLPSMNHVHDREVEAYVRRLHQLWKSYRSNHSGPLMHESDWQFFRLRPENFPTVRLAAVARLIPQFAGTEILRALIQLIKADELSESEKLCKLREFFLVEADGFWSTHYHFGAPTAQPSRHLLGTSRAYEIVQNVVIPISLLYARIFKDRLVRESAMRLLEAPRAAASNSIQKIISNQLVKGKVDLSSTLLRQGSLQLYKFYCVEEQCEECALGRVVFAGGHAPDTHAGHS